MTLDREEKRRLLKECEDGVRRALVMDPADARSYVILGKTLMMQKRYDEARLLYSEGCTNTGPHGVRGRCMRPHMEATHGVQAAHAACRAAATPGPTRHQLATHIFTCCAVLGASLAATCLCAPCRILDGVSVLTAPVLLATTTMALA